MIDVHSRLAETLPPKYRNVSQEPLVATPLDQGVIRGYEKFSEAYPLVEWSIARICRSR